MSAQDKKQLEDQRRALAEKDQMIKNRNAKDGKKDMYGRCGIELLSAKLMYQIA